MPQAWSAVETSPEYQKLAPEEQSAAKEQYFSQVVAQKPEFQHLPDEEKQAAASQFLGAKPAEQPDSMMKRGFGGLATYPEAHPFKTMLQPAAKTITGKSLEDMATEHVKSEEFTRPPADAPFDRNLDQINPKASLEIGAAQNLDLLSNPINAVGGPLVKAGGEALGLATKAIEGFAPSMRGTAGWIYNQLSKVGDKAFRYGKDPLNVMAKERVTANSTPGLVDAYEQRLGERNQQLQQGLANSDKTINAGEIVDKHLEDASGKLTGSLKDRTADIKELDTMKQRLTEQYGDLNNLSVQDAVKLKRQLADDYPFTRENSTDINANAAHKIYHDINSAIEDAHPEIKELNESVSSLIDITKATRTRMAIEARSNPLGLINTLIGAGTGAAFGHGAEGAAVGLSTAILAKASQSPIILTRVAKALSIMSDVDKIQLFKASPDFMQLAEKAGAFAGSIGAKLKSLTEDSSNLGFAGKAGANAVEETPKESPATFAGTEAPQKMQSAASRMFGNQGQANIGGDEKSKIPFWYNWKVGDEIHGLGKISDITEHSIKFVDENGKPAGSLGKKTTPLPESVTEKIGIKQSQGKMHDMTKEIFGDSQDKIRQLQQEIETRKGQLLGEKDPSARSMISKNIQKLTNALKDLGASPLGLGIATGVGTAAAVGAKNANAKETKIKDEDAIKTIIGEGESTGFQGMRALASAIRNRGTLQGAYGIKSPRVTKKLYSAKTERLARQAWEDSKKKDYSDGANHWFSDADLKKQDVKQMTKGMQRLKSFRGNNFYKEQGRSK